MTAQSHASAYGAISVGSFWQLWMALRNHAPDWQLVPPLLVGLVGLVSAVNTTLNDRHRRRQERRKLDAELLQAAEDAAARRRQMQLPYIDKFENQN